MSHRATGLTDVSREHDGKLGQHLRTRPHDYYASDTNTSVAIGCSSGRVNSLSKHQGPGIDEFPSTQVHLRTGSPQNAT